MVSTHVSSKLEIEKFCSRLIDVINREIAYEGHSFHVGASIGVALAPEHGGDPRGLLLLRRRGDVRGQGRGAQYLAVSTWKRWDSHLAEKKLRETELRAALQNGEFELYYQPRFLAQEQTFASAEALIRWNHPHAG
ncbi:EAL domain-containing protein [Pseudomonas aeruginosa]|uniref:EAL domain-containing protein n=1 Tax=Pseudomonas aeruginosa TaxID=287 RepID=UPI003D28C393